MKKIINWFKDNRVAISIAKMAIFALLLVAALRWDILINVSLVVAIIFALTEFEFDGFYFCFFLVNFRFIFRNELAGNIPYVSVVLAIYAIAACIKYYLIRKEKLKLNWWVIGFSAAFLLYLLLPIHPFIFGEYFKFVVMIFAINFIFLFKDKIEFKKLVLAFAYGCIFASFIYLFTQYLFKDYFYNMQLHVTALGKTRFRGCAGDPNYYSVDLLLSMAGLFVLFFKKQINTWYYIVLSLILVNFAWLTYSKSFLIGLVSFIVCIAIVMLNKIKFNWYKSLTFVAIVLAGFIMTNYMFKMDTINLLKRFDESYITINTEQSTSSQDKTENSDKTDKDETSTDKESEKDSQEDKTEQNNDKETNDKFAYDVPGGENDGSEKLDNLLTGRWTLWKNHLKFVFDSPKNFLIGGGIGTFVKPMECHNTYIQIIYETGFVGTILFGGLMVSLLWGMGFNKKMFNFRKWINWVVLAVCCVMFLNVNYFGSTSFIYHVFLCLFSLFDKKEDSNEEESVT